MARALRLALEMCFRPQAAQKYQIVSVGRDTTRRLRPRVLGECRARYVPSASTRRVGFSNVPRVETNASTALWASTRIMKALINVLAVIRATARAALPA